MLSTASGRGLFRVLLISLVCLGLLVPPRWAHAEVAEDPPTPDATVGLWVSIAFGGPGYDYGPLPAGLTPDGAGNIVGIPAQAGDVFISATSPPSCSVDEEGNEICVVSGVLRLLPIADSALRGTPTVLTGSGQAAAPGQSFGSPLTARLTDGSGAIAPSTEVTFTVTQGPATFATGDPTSAKVRTNANGVATAPALVAGATTGPVLVTVSQPGSTDAVYMLTVAAPGPARADLAISLQAPSSVASGSTFTVIMTVRNLGPSNGSKGFAALILPSGLRVRDAGGGTQGGPVVYWSLGTLAAGSTSTRIVTIEASNSRGTRSLGAAAVSATRDPKPLSNVTVRSVRVT